MRQIVLTKWERMRKAGAAPLYRPRKSSNYISPQGGGGGEAGLSRAVAFIAIYPITFPPDPDLRSDKYTLQKDKYRLQFGEIHYQEQTHSSQSPQSLSQSSQSLSLSWCLTLQGLGITSNVFLETCECIIHPNLVDQLVFRTLVTSLVQCLVLSLYFIFWIYSSELWYMSC